MERLTMTTNATSESGASSPLSLDALATPSVPGMPKRRRTSACDDLSLLHFSTAVREELMEKIGAVAEGIMESMGAHDGPSDKHWRLKSTRHGVDFFEDRTPARRGQARFCCLSTAEATVEEVAQIFVLADDEALRDQCRILYDNVVNAKVLSVLEYPSHEHPYRSVYVRYTAFETPKVLRSHRDMLVIVATDVITFPDGSTVGYCVWDSLHLSQLTALDIPPGFVRSRMFRSGYFIKNSGERNALTKVAYIVGIEAGGFVPRLATRFVMPRFGTVLERVCEHVKSKKSLDPRTFVLRSQWANVDDARFCQCCLKDFPEEGGRGFLGSSRLGSSRLGASLLGASRLGASRMGASRFGSSRSNDKRTNCHACGEVVCSACAQLESVNLSGVKLVKIPVCIPCRTTAAQPVKTSLSSAADTFKPVNLGSSVARRKPVESIWL